MLYSCGLRVSELIELKMSRVDLIDGVVKVVGKATKSASSRLDNRLATPSTTTSATTGRRDPFEGT